MAVPRLITAHYAGGDVCTSIGVSAIRPRLLAFTGRTAHETQPQEFWYQVMGAIETSEERMRNFIIFVIVIVVAAAALWYTPQGRSLLQKFGIATADVITTTAIS